MNWIALTVCFLSTTAWAGPEYTCVRNYVANGSSPCASGATQFFATTVSDRHPDQDICVRTADDWLCKDAPAEYDHIRTVDGTLVCVLNYNQPATGNYCAAAPDSFFWVPLAYPED